MQSPPSKSPGAEGESVESLQWSTTSQELVGDNQKALKWSSSSTQFGVTLVEPNDSVVPLSSPERGHKAAEDIESAELLGADSRPQSRVMGTMVIDLHNVTLDAPRSIEDTDTSAKNGRSARTTHTIGGIGPISPTAVRVQDLGSDLTLDQVSVGRVGEGGEIGPLTSGRRVYPSPPCSTALNVNGMTSNTWGALGPQLSR